MINTKHKDYAKWSPVWAKTRDAIEGQEAVKSKRTVYLPKLSGQTDSAYNNYLHRAQFVNFTSRTLTAAIGQLFRKDPVLTVDEEYLENIDLAGTSFFHFSREMAREIMTTNRVGILVDYSDSLDRPYLVKYRAEEIINWQTQIIDGQKILTLVVLEGTIPVQSGSKYEIEDKTIWRELSLEDVYIVREFEKIDDNFVMISEKIPEQNGQPLSFIPFYFCTSEGVTEQIRKATLADFVNVNLAHYVNSADFENMVHWAGQKTVIATGWGTDPFPIGGNAVLEKDGQAYYLESSSDSCIENAMNKKEEQMAVMGSQIITGKGRYVASAETARITSEGEYATLADISNSLSYCVDQFMRFFVEWATGREAEIDVEYNTDFSVQEMPQGALVELMGAVQAGYISYETFFYNLKNYEVFPAHWTIEKELEAIEQYQAIQKEKRSNDVESEIRDLMESEDEL